MLIPLFLLTVVFSFSQQWSGSIKFGSLYGAPIGPANEGDEGYLRLGPGFGVGIQYEANSWLTIHADMMLMNKKGGYDAVAEGDTIYEFEIPGQPPALFPTTYKGRVKGEFDNTYLDFPLYASIKWKRSRTHLGVYNGFLLSGYHAGKTDLVLGNNFSTIKEDFDDSDFISTFDFGILIGGEFEIIKNQLAIGFRGTYGLTSIFKPDYPNVKDKFSNLYMYPYIRISVL